MDAHRQTVMIVDDEPANVAVLVEALGAEQEILVATSGKEALDVAITQDPDLILLDVVMPEMDGYEVCRRLKGDVLTRNIPIIFVSAVDLVDEEAKGLDIGAIDYITKPVQRRIVKARVHNHLELKRYRDLLENMSTTDGLTGIANRRMMDEVLDREWRRAIREGEPLALVMMDCDCFKPFNDHYSHLAGDDCLRMVARILAESARRGTDLPVRYGGDEFACILPNTHLTGALRVANRIQASLNELAIPHAFSAAADWVTVSMGVAVMVPTLETPMTVLIQRADAMLNEAKRCGGNQFKALDITDQK